MSEQRPGEQEAYRIPGRITEEADAEGHGVRGRYATAGAGDAGEVEGHGVPGNGDADDERKGHGAIVEKRPSVTDDTQAHLLRNPAGPTLPSAADEDTEGHAYRWRG